MRERSPSRETGPASDGTSTATRRTHDERPAPPRRRAQPTDAGEDSAPTTTAPLADAGDPTPPTKPPTTPSCAIDAATGAPITQLGTACLDATRWTEEAAKACATKGGFASVRVGPACGYFRYREFRCCGSDGACTDHRDGSTSSCKPFEIWRTYSDGDCAREGRVLVSMTLDTSCGPAAPGFQSATYRCCK